MLLAGRIIAASQDDTPPLDRPAALGNAQHPVQHPPQHRQALKRGQRPRRLPPSALQVRPRRRNQRPAAVRQHQQQLQPPPPAHPTEQPKLAALQRMARPCYPNRRREAIEMGSVSCGRSTIPVAIGHPWARAVG